MTARANMQDSALKASARYAKAHVCPAWCHKCPLLADAIRDGVLAGTRQSGSTREELIMPGCWGMTVGSYCTCTKPSAKARKKAGVRALRARVRALEERLEKLEEQS